MSQEPKITKNELLNNIQKGWEEFNAYLKTLTESQLNTPTDAAGWTAKDHIMHMTMWEDGMIALIQKRSRHEQMGIEENVWKNAGYDAINDMIFRQHQDKPLAEVMKTFVTVHQNLVNSIQQLTDEDLYRPYSYFSPSDEANSSPVINRLIGNTYHHYEEHQPWIEAIVAQK